MRNACHALGLILLLSVPTAALAAHESDAAPRETVLTLGTIQRVIKNGLSANEVLDAAGSPNLVTRGRNGRESWVYDRFSTETSEQGFQVGGGGVGGGGSFLGALGLGGGRKKSSTSQRTLMLVVIFGPEGLVESFTYRSSRF